MEIYRNLVFYNQEISIFNFFIQLTRLLFNVLILFFYAFDPTCDIVLLFMTFLPLIYKITRQTWFKLEEKFLNQHMHKITDPVMMDLYVR
jgi:hypothetical protein